MILRNLDRKSLWLKPKMVKILRYREMIFLYKVSEVNKSFARILSLTKKIDNIKNCHVLFICMETQAADLRPLDASSICYPKTSLCFVLILQDVAKVEGITFLLVGMSVTMLL